jgi:CBS domain-containing membrane protein
MRQTDNLTVGDLMLRDLKTAREEDGVEKVYASMLEGRFRHMPVVDAKNRLVGIVSDRDLRNVLVFINDKDGERKAIGDKKLTIGRVMTREPMAADPGDSLKTAVRVMIKHKFGCLPVVDEKERLMGLVTETDLLKLLEELLTVKKAT